MGFKLDLESSRVTNPGYVQLSLANFQSMLANLGYLLLATSLNLRRL